MLSYSAIHMWCSWVFLALHGSYRFSIRGSGNTRIILNANKQKLPEVSDFIVTFKLKLRSKMLEEDAVSRRQME